MKATTRHRQAAAPVQPWLILVGAVVPLAAIVLVSMLGSPEAAASIGVVWGATCGVLIRGHLLNGKTPD
jgi:hypothetical protein